MFAESGNLPFGSGDCFELANEGQLGTIHKWCQAISSHFWAPSLSLCHSRNLSVLLSRFDNPLPPLVRDLIYGRSPKARGEQTWRILKYFEAGSGQVKREQVKTSRNHGEIFWNVGILGRISMFPTRCDVQMTSAQREGGGCILGREVAWLCMTIWVGYRNPPQKGISQGGFSL